MIINSGIQYRSIAAQKEFSFSFDITASNSSGISQVGFSGDSGILPLFDLKSGNIFDINQKNIWSYNPREVVTFSGNIGSNYINYFINDNPICLFSPKNNEYYYNEEYKIKDLLKICQYYGIASSVKAAKCKKQDIVSTIVYFESLPENYEIVEKRHKMWAFITELLEDTKMKSYLIW